MHQRPKLHFFFSLTVTFSRQVLCTWCRPLSSKLPFLILCSLVQPSPTTAPLELLS